MQPGDYSIEHHPRVLREDIPKLDRVTRERIARIARAKLGVDPLVFGEPLRLSLKGARKLRIGSYRVVHEVRDSRVRIVSIRHRSKGYEGIEERLDA